MQSIGISSALESKIEYYKKELEKLPTKLYFEQFDTAELYKNLEIDYDVISKQEPNRIHFIVSVKNNFEPELPSNFKYAIDGILRVKLYCDDITDVLVDEFYAALPEKGILCGGDDRLCYYPEKYMVNIDDNANRKYRCEIYPHKLWLMEQ